MDLRLREMKIKTYSEFKKKMAEAEKLEAKYKRGETTYREETKFLRLMKEMREFMANVKVKK